MLGGEGSSASMPESDVIKEIDLFSYLSVQELEWVILEYFVRNGYPETALTFWKSLDNPANASPLVPFGLAVTAPSTSSAAAASVGGGEGRRNLSSAARRAPSAAAIDEDAMDVDGGESSATTSVLAESAVVVDKGKSPISKTNFSNWLESFAWKSMGLRRHCQKLVLAGQLDRLMSILAKDVPFVLSAEANGTFGFNTATATTTSYEQKEEDGQIEFFPLEKLTDLIKPFSASPSLLLFQLMSQSYVERVRAGLVEEALSFAQLILGPLALGHNDWLQDLQDYATLLAYNDPMDSPVAHFLDEKRRADLYNSINQTILSPSSSSGDDFCRSERLEQIIKQVSIVRTTYNDEFGNPLAAPTSSSSGSSKKPAVASATIPLDPWDFEKWVDDGLSASSLTQ